jgi:hypothetical protein
MTTKFTYPGMYLDEIESNVRPIVGSTPLCRHSSG